MELHSKLNALQIEIDAVASSIEYTGLATTFKESKSESNGISEDVEENKGTSSQDYTLQHALVADRLQSLKRTRSKLQKQLSNLNANCLSSGIGGKKALEDLVREDSRAKPKLKTGQESIKQQKKQKHLSVLNAAFRRFIETEREELISKGILTPFHKLKRYERQIQQPGQSRVPIEEETNNHISSIVERVACSLVEAVKARPTTKLLETEELPKLDAPADSFQRLTTPFKLQRTSDGKEEKGRDVKRKSTKPLDGKKCRKQISREGLIGIIGIK